MATNDYMLDLANARKAAKEVKEHFTDEDLYKENPLVKSMIKICARDYSVTEEFVSRELFNQVEA